MLLAGIEITTELVAELASRLRDEYYVNAADTLDHALETNQAHVSLTIRQRTAILDVLDDPPAAFEELRVVLLNEHTWRIREGLAPGRVF